jgi:hypothetical protein
MIRHDVPVGYVSSLPQDYLPTESTSDDYPHLIENGARVDTIAVPAALAVYNWAPNSERYRRLAQFAVLQQPPFHSKWKEVAVNARLPGRSRFRSAQEWLDQNGNTLAGFDMRQKFDRFLSDDASARAAAPPKPNDDLFQQFLEWRKERADPH